MLCASAHIPMEICSSVHFNINFYLRDACVAVVISVFVDIYSTVYIQQGVKMASK